MATDAVRHFLSTHDMDVFLSVLYDEALATREELLGKVAGYPDAHDLDGHREHLRSIKPLGSPGIPRSKHG